MWPTGELKNGGGESVCFSSMTTRMSSSSFVLCNLSCTQLRVLQKYSIKRAVWLNKDSSRNNVPSSLHFLQSHSSLVFCNTIHPPSQLINISKETGIMKIFSPNEWNAFEINYGQLLSTQCLEIFFSGQHTRLDRDLSVRGLINIKINLKHSSEDRKMCHYVVKYSGQHSV